MTVEDFLKNPDFNARLSCGSKWLSWQDEWIVCERSYGKKVTRYLYEGTNLSEALEILA